MLSNNKDNLVLEHFTKQPPLQPFIILDFYLALCHPLSYHGDGDPHSEAESEVLSVRDAALTNRQAVT